MQFATTRTEKGEGQVSSSNTPKSRGIDIERLNSGSSSRAIHPNRDSNPASGFPTMGVSNSYAIPPIIVFCKTRILENIESRIDGEAWIVFNPASLLTTKANSRRDDPIESQSILAFVLNADQSCRRHCHSILPKRVFMSAFFSR